MVRRERHGKEDQRFLPRADEAHDACVQQHEHADCDSHDPPGPSECHQVRRCVLRIVVVLDLIREPSKFVIPGLTRNPELVEKTTGSRVKPGKTILCIEPFYPSLPAIYKRRGFP